MSILITDTNAIDKIAEVEGEAWFSQQRRSLFYSIRHASEGYNLNYTIYGAIAKWKSHQEEYGDHTDFHYTIYGDGGWNRYHVREDGRIVFSRYHAFERSIPKAIAAGFDIE